MLWGKKYKRKQRETGDTMGTECTAHISHTFAPQWLMLLWTEAEMAVARIHGKVRCRPFERKEEDTANKTWLGLPAGSLFHCFYPLRYFSCPQGFWWVLVVASKRGTRGRPSLCFLPPSPGSELKWLVVSKDRNLFEWAIWTADLMVRQSRSHWCNPNSYTLTRHFIRWNVQLFINTNS